MTNIGSSVGAGGIFEINTLSTEGSGKPAKSQNEFNLILTGIKAVEVGYSDVVLLL